MKTDIVNLTPEQKAKLIAAYLLSKKDKPSDKKEKPTPWKTLLGFRNV